MKTKRSALLDKHLSALVVLGLLAAGCASRHAIEPQHDNSNEKGEIQRTLQSVFAAAETKDFERLDRFHAYGPKFTKYAGASPERMDAEASRKEEHSSLGSLQGLQMRAKDLKIDLFGDVAVATFILDYSNNSEGRRLSHKATSTLVFVKQGGVWKICHEHFTRVGNDEGPNPADQPAR